MKDKTKKQLIEESEALCKQVARLKKVVIKNKKVEEILRQSENKYRVLIENLPQKIFLKDRNSVYISCNENYARDLKITSDTIAGKTDYDFFPKELAEKYRADDQRIMKSGKVENLEEKYLQNGREVWVHTVKTPIRNKKGDTIGILGIFWDITESKQTEEALKYSEKRYRDLVDTTIVGVYQTDIKGNVFYVNEAMVRILEFNSAAELISENILNTYKNPKDREVLIEKLKRNRKVVDYELELRARSGRIIHVLLNAILEGDVLSGVMLDVTERKQAEEKIRGLYQRTHDILEKAPFGIYLINSAGAVEYVNPMMQVISGTSDDKFTLLNVFELPTYQKIGLTDKIRAALRGKPFFMGPVEYTSLYSGKTTIRNFSGIPFEEEGKNKVLIFVEDLTERAHAEAALKESEKKYHTLFDQAADLIAIVDVKGNFLDLNKKFEEESGWNREEMIGKNVFTCDILTEPSAQRISFHLNQLLFGEKPPILEIEGVRKDGGIVPFELRASPIVKDDKILAIQAILRNITERKKNEQKIRLYQKQLTSLVSELSLTEERERRRLASELHDYIGQTLAITKIKCAALQELASATQLVGSVNEIQELIEQAIQYTRSLTFELSPPILYELGLEAAVEWLAEQMQKQHVIRVEIKKDKHLKPLDDNVRILLFQAIRELMLNIVKHAKAHRTKICIKRDGDTIRITIQDDGIGFNVSEFNTNVWRTGGFGLFSIRERIGQIGGRFEIKSESGNGTRVTLVAPLMVKKETRK